MEIAPVFKHKLKICISNVAFSRKIPKPRLQEAHGREATTMCVDYNLPASYDYPETAALYAKDGGDLHGSKMYQKQSLSTHRFFIRRLTPRLYTCYRLIHMYRTRIYYQDTDAGGVVYFANYLKLFEKSWYEHLLSLGIALPEWEEKGVYLMVKSARVDLNEKLRYGDEVDLETSVVWLRTPSFPCATLYPRAAGRSPTGRR